MPTSTHNAPHLALKCPKCACVVTGCALMKHATQAITRTCRRCHRRWRIILRPMGPLQPLPGSFATMAEWTEFPRQAPPPIGNKAPQ